MHIVGIAIKTPPVVDNEGNIITPAEYYDGWHVNALEPIPEWDAYRVYPDKPMRRYAAPAETVFYRFADEQAFIEARNAAFGEPDDDADE
jgi:hypothetical protein